MCAGVGSGGNFRKVPEGSGRFRRVPVCAGVGSGGRFGRVPVCAGVASGGRFRKVRRVGKVPESSGVCWCRFRRQLPEGSVGLRRVPVFRKVQESFGVVCCLATLTGAAMRLFLNFFW